ncbi:uncharacterized protein EKO05_0007799 [Ascochyta rabiei]|uniref:uncharacterized protein n=1 Tax=Didymella rabiei TaxID=5454 RepID=UPI0021FCD6EE|nr:uncharacterized protein EKO05_0007799 [Ascochyta rabiei]UPX17446.1 hypothetical protein EKO05_0007799 [Ascochyta rabiei]
MNQENFSQAQLDQFFNTTGTDGSFYHPEISETSEGAHFDFDPSHFAPTDSSALSSVSTPTFSDYDFGQPSSGYSTPSSNTSQLYSTEQQPCFNPNLAGPLPIRQRSQPMRSHTNTSYLHLSHPPPQYTRRRSLSQSDAERIAAINIHPNPTFLRLQAPRARSTAPDEHLRKRRAGPYRRGHSRSTSQGPNGACPTGDNTLASRSWNSNLVGGMVPTSIGTPLYPISPRHRRPALDQRMPLQHEDLEREVVFRSMTRPDQMERSRRIIEIGAMVAGVPLDPTLQNNARTILKKLEEVEQYLKQEIDDCEAALKGCIMIREVLTRELSIVKYEDSANNTDADRVTNSTLDIPSTMLSTQDNDLLGSGIDDGDIMAMLIKENENCQPSDDP